MSQELSVAEFCKWNADVLDEPEVAQYFMAEFGLKHKSVYDFYKVMLREVLIGKLQMFPNVCAPQGVYHPAITRQASPASIMKHYQR